MPLDLHTIKHWPFEPQSRRYDRDDLVRYARGFGAGMPGALQQGDAAFLDAPAQALPMAAVALADGQFWQQDPRAGLNWKQIVHAEEAITLHRPLPLEGSMDVKRRVVEVYDRGADKGAMVLEQMQLEHDAQGLIATVDVITVLRADGGFGGSAQGAPKPRPVPADRAPDLVLELPSPASDNTVFQLSSEFDVSVAVRNAAPGQRMLRGVCAFGLAGRGVLHLVCGNDPQRLQQLSVRYTGPLLTDETLRLELWQTGEGAAAFRARALERDAPVLDHCHLRYTPG